MQQISSLAYNFSENKGGKTNISGNEWDLLFMPAILIIAPDHFFQLWEDSGKSCGDWIKYSWIKYKIIITGQKITFEFEKNHSNYWQKIMSSDYCYIWGVKLGSIS